MRPKLIAMVLAAFLQTGCAGGFRIGGNNYGAGIGAYIGPVPDAIKQDRSYYPPAAYPPAPVIETPAALPIK